MEGEKQLNNDELDFFLKGNTSLEQVARRPPYKWVSEQGWKDMQKLVHIGEEYKNFILDLENNEELFKKWYDFECPEQEELPLVGKKKYITNFCFVV